MVAPGRGIEPAGLGKQSTRIGRILFAPVSDHAVDAGPQNGPRLWQQSSIPQENRAYFHLAPRLLKTASLRRVELPDKQNKNEMRRLK
jgi:hypothetical protein